jgi:hypothetical protein
VSCKPSFQVGPATGEGRRQSQGDDSEDRLNEYRAGFTWHLLYFDDPTLYLLLYVSLLGSPPAGENRRHPQNRGEYADVRG